MRWAVASDTHIRSAISARRVWIWTGFSIIRAQWIAQKGSGEVTTFAQKMLNDNLTSANGLNTGSGCTQQTPASGAGTVTVSGNSVAGSGTNFSSTLVVGSVIFTSGNLPMGTVAQVVSNTQIYLTTPAVNAANGSWLYAAAWGNPDCGLVWLDKHHQSAPPIVSGQQGGYATNYAPDGGTSAGYDYNISMENLIYYFIMV